MNFKKLRNYFLVSLIIIYIGILIFEAVFNFNGGVISKLLSNYNDFSEPIYVFFILISIMTGLLSVAVVFSGYFIFNIPTLIILTSIGIILGIPLIFILSKKIGQKSFEDYININKDRAKRLKDIFKNDSTALVVLFNFVSFLPSTFGGIVGGLSGLKKSKLIRLIVTSIIGNLLNQIAFIFFILGTQGGNLIYLIPSLSILLLDTTIPLLIYRKNIKNILMIIFKRKKL